MKRILSLILCITLITSAIPIAAAAQETGVLGGAARAAFTGRDKVLPTDQYWSFQNNTLTLRDFQFDGSLCLVGDELTLVIAGDCRIGALTIECGVTLQRQCYASLQCGDYSCMGGGSLRCDPADRNTMLDTAFGLRVYFAFEAGHAAEPIFRSEQDGFASKLFGDNNGCWGGVSTTPVGVSDCGDFTNGCRLVKGNNPYHAFITLDLTDQSAVFTEGDAVYLTFYARVVSEDPSTTADGAAFLWPTAYYNGGKNRGDALNNQAGQFSLTGSWQQYRFSGNWLRATVDYPQLFLMLGVATPNCTVEYCGVALHCLQTLSQAEQIEFTGKYDFPWRHRNAAWFQAAQANIQNHRTEDLKLFIRDENGAPAAGASVSVQEIDHAYGFGMGGDPRSYMGTNGETWNELLRLKNEFMENTSIFYSAPLWENFDPSHPGEYNFDYTDQGNTTYVSDAVRMMNSHGIQVTAHTLLYPSLAMTHSNGKSSAVYEQIVSYVLSNEYTPAGFYQMLLNHIREEITAYAGVFYDWEICNEAFYQTDFFVLLYDTELDFSGITTDAQLEAYLAQRPRIAPETVGKCLASFADTALQAWVDAGYAADEITFFYNDAMYKHDPREPDHYPYVYALARQLAEPGNYQCHTVLVDTIGLQLCQWMDYDTSPQEVWEMLDDFEALGMRVRITEMNYWLDYPIAAADSESTLYGIPFYTPVGCASPQELEFMYDYAYAIFTALYAHRNSVSICTTSYPHGQVGFFYAWDMDNRTPLGQAWQDLVCGRWRTTSVGNTEQSGVYTVSSADQGSYSVQVQHDGKQYNFTLSNADGNGSYLLDLASATAKPAVVYDNATGSKAVSLIRAVFDAATGQMKSTVVCSIAPGSAGSVDMTCSAGESVKIFTLNSELRPLLPVQMLLQ